MLDYQTLLKVRDYLKFNKLEFYKPYPYQLKFANASAHYKQRFLRSANRIGKSYGTAAEFAQHITGRYQDWFEGERLQGSGRTFWCVGIDLTSVAKVLQKELLGTRDIRQTSLIGTGFIPKDHIIMDPMVKDGGSVKIMSIKHIDGGINTLMFYGSNNEASMMGDTVDFIWLDEEPEHHSAKIYAQCLTRTMTTHGHVMITATPEQGQTELNDLFDNDKTGELYIQQATWWDAHVDIGGHITDADIRKMSAGIPAWQLDMRSKGLPVMGEGAVFEFNDDDISVSNLQIEDHWRVCAGVDFGMVVDPSVVIRSAHDVDNDVYYLYAETYLNDDRSPKAIAESILSSESPRIPVIVPHDGGLNSDAPETKGKMLVEYGVNVYGTFRNPLDTKLGMLSITTDSQSVRSIASGLTIMNKLFSEGRLKVDKSLLNWFKEKRSYFHKRKSTGEYGYAGEDHCIDASRYSVISLFDGKGITYAEAKNLIKPVAPIRRIGL